MKWFKPSLIIGPEDNPYLKRWCIIPDNRYFNIYLHQFLRDDDDRALHDHPWKSLSFILKGSYYETTIKGEKYWPRWSVIYRNATDGHRVNVSKTGGTAWTLFITGRTVRDWGFHCATGWKHWKEFLGISNLLEKRGRGPGCG